MTVYVDVLFFINFAFNLEILVILLKIYSKTIPKARLLFSAILGGMQGVFTFVPYFRILSLPPVFVIFPLVMVMAVFLPCSRKEVISAWISFLTISFVFSGAISFFDASGIWSVLLPVPIYAAVCILKKRAIRKKDRVTLVYKDRTASYDGFFDSGNMLSYNGAPVILANGEVFENLLGKGFCREAAWEWVEAEDLRFVPYTALGGKGVVFGVRLDSCIVGKRCFENVILGFAENDFSDNLILNTVMV